MRLQSENQADIGRHAFEVAGLGKAPFRFVGHYEAKFQAAPGAPVLPGASCDFCGTAIMGVYRVKSADGKEFKVGCDCIERTGDHGLIRAYKHSPEYRAKQREARQRRDQKVIAGWKAMMEDDASCAILSAYKIDSYHGGKEPWLDRAHRAWPYCGASGRGRYFREAKDILKRATANQ